MSLRIGPSFRQRPPRTKSNPKSILRCCQQAESLVVPRRRPPTVLVPSEIKALVDNLDLRERTLVLLAASTGLRQSEMFGLKWGDIDFAQRNMSVTRSIVYGVVARARPSRHRSPCPFLRFLPTHCCNGRKVFATRMETTGYSPASAIEVEDRSGAKRPCGNIFVRLRRGLELRSDSDGTRSGTHTRLCCEVWGPSSR